MKTGDLVRHVSKGPMMLRALGFVIKTEFELGGEMTENPLVEVYWISGYYQGRTLFMTRSNLRKVSPAPFGKHLSQA